ncbi:hypothetical protein [Thermogemmatispora sp.]|uniref:hypothetical protein n=1 Tax=Thermogemmatispora sp. TaxID=1968838 RepID=UPI0035E400CD
MKTLVRATLHTCLRRQLDEPAVAVNPFLWCSSFRHFGPLVRGQHGQRWVCIGRYQEAQAILSSRSVEEAPQ